MKRIANVVFPLLLFAFVVAALLWQRWYGGRVIARAHFSSGEWFPSSGLRCVIREYPKSKLPFTGDGYFYGCEVRWRQVLLTASAYNWDSYAADQCRIDIPSPREVIFKIGTRRIRCTNFGWSTEGVGATWHLPE